MSNAKLQRLLYARTESEEWHLAHPGEPSPRYTTVPHVTVDGQDCLLFDWKRTLQESAVGMIRESRFTTVPPHINQDMELSYVYDGSCDFVVNGRHLSLRQGDLLICDAGVVRSSPSLKGERDIVISAVFKKDFFDAAFLSRLPGASPLTTLLFDVVSNNRKRDRYLILPEAYMHQAREIIELLFLEYHFQDMYSHELIASLVSCLFLEVIRGLYRRSKDAHKTLLVDERVAFVLNHVERHYKTCTLASVSKLAGYNQNYLGNLIKRKTGKTFSEIKVGQQLSEAAYLLDNTDRSIVSIAKKVGISNMSYFYAKFKSMFGMTPRAYRQRDQLSGGNGV